MVHAALQVAAADGIAAVTVARVGKQAGVSVGLVQHYFASKSSLIEAAYVEVLRRTDERIVALVDDGERAGRPIRAMAQDALALLLPLDARRRQECGVRQEFAALAVRDPDLWKVAAENDARSIVRLAAVVRNGLSCGEVRQGVDAERAAQGLLAVVVGAAELGLRVGKTVDVRGVVDDAVARVFSGECRAHAAAVDRSSAPGG